MEDSEETQLKLYMLGKSHASKFIKPYLYSVRSNVAQTVAFRLGTDATNQIMEAWVNQFAFVMRSMLPGN
jgi:hemoglobin-like flavoprotein